MNYRKLRKKYIRRFGTVVSITLRDKSGKVMRRASKRATAHFLKQCLRSGCDGLELLTQRSERINHQESVL
jgi:hypothetical protein